MLKRFSFLLLLVAILAPSAVSLAQQPESADEVKSLLTSKGYKVQQVDFFPDANGNPSPDAVYVLMDSVSGDLDGEDIALQATWGFAALRKYYPRVTNLLSVLAYKQYAFFFVTDNVTLDQFLNQKLSGADFWGDVRRRVKIYDSVKKSFIDEKTFTTNDQSTKDQTTKDFTKNPPNPAPTPTPSAAPAGDNLLLEPSTTYLPSDNKTAAVMIATLRNKDYAALVGQQVTFAYEVKGEGATELGSQNTDANGTARAAIRTGESLDEVLLRAATATQNSQVPIVVGPAVTTKDPQAAAVVKGLESQGYQGVEVDYQTSVGPTGQSESYVIVGMRMVSASFDRAVFSQMSRAIGTARTVFPRASMIALDLIYRKDGKDYELIWTLQPAYWDQFVAGQISENDFWRNLLYRGAYDPDGQMVGDKNFISKDFGAGTGAKEAQIKRTLESKMTHEDWGDQWNGQEFVVLPGSYADTFNLAELSGSATQIEIFQSPEFRTPLFTYKKGDSLDALKKLRLGQGQYYFAVVAASAPALARLTYIEHLPQ